MTDYRLLIKRHLRFLVENLEPRHQFIESLWSYRLLTRVEFELVKSKLTVFEKNECLLVILLGKKRKLFFREGCMDIVELLELRDSASLNNSEDQLGDNDDRLGEKVLCCHHKITEIVDSRHVRLYLLEKDIISHEDYKEYLIPTDPYTDRRSLCESMMYLLTKDTNKVNRNLQHFMHILNKYKRYSEVVRQIAAADIDGSYGYSAHRPCVANLKMETGVRGIAVLGGYMYAVLHEQSHVYVCSTQVIETGDSQTHKCIEVASGEKTRIVLKWPADIVANQRHGVLYISDRGISRDGSTHRPGLFAFHPNTEDAVFTPLDGATPAGISMTSDNMLLVACEHANHGGRSLHLYDVQTDGCIRSSRCKVIDLSMLSRYLLQPVMFDRGVFAISQIKKRNLNLHRICLADDKGKEKARSFGGRERSAWPSVRSPWGVMKDPINSCRLIVSSCHEHKISLLDDKLSFLVDLISQKNCNGFDFLCPRCLCYDEQTSLLYVGRRWKGKVGDKLSDTLGAISVFRM